MDDNSDLPTLPPAVSPPTTATFNNAVRDPATGKFAANTQDPQERPPQSVAHPSGVPDSPPARRPSPFLAEAARSVGIPDYLIESADPDQLRQDVQLAHLLRSQPQQVPAREAEVPEPEDEFDDAWDPKLVHALKSTRKESRETRKELKAIREENAKLRQESQKRDQDTFTSSFDALCAQHPDVFGPGAIHQLQPGSPEALRRQMAYQQAHAMTQGRGGPALDRAFQNLLAVFGQASTPSEPPAGHYRAEQWNRGGLVPPSPRTGAQPELTRRERMIREEAARQRHDGAANGRHPAPVFPEDNSDLPHV